ncbi:LEA type 2 family protein [Psychroserpens ponticola]|uniref:LEA type 2 family protein n=1 Tax=Psychroserpens ponticola TaxID=2932268 RepID=A0ABY7RUS9_9FLAO|nr:LEA type 2 family protein [Psychroserpens ponticola]WCO00527.1 LEA type 2 family protein [Psychroserpens ponticola]
MKKLIILSTLVFTFISCSVKEKPKFLRVENIKVLESTSKTITLTADALFMNPNDIGGELKTDGIKVIVNGNEMASVSTESFKVPAKKEFSIPLRADVPTDSLFSDKNLSGLLGSLFNKKMKVQYKGDIKYKVLGFSHTYTVDETEDVKIKF